MNEYLREYIFEDESIPVVKVCQNPSPQLGHAGTVWDAGLVLCAFLESAEGVKLIKDSKCIELGAGTGIVSLVAASRGATEVLVTDLSACVPFIRQNIGMNVLESSVCKAEVLDWNETSKADSFAHAFDWVLCADCVYDPSLVDGLIRTVLALNPKRGVIISNERREADSNASAERSFIKSLYEAGFAGKAVHKDVIRPDWRCEDIDVVVFTRENDSAKGA
jgi:16S rRNA G966 N2-methylase RsmD